MDKARVRDLMRRQLALEVGRFETTEAAGLYDIINGIFRDPYHSHIFRDSNMGVGLGGPWNHP